MSLGRCECPCEQWDSPDHQGICTGTVGASLPTAPHLEGWAEKPCCRACYTAIVAETDRRAIAPEGAA